MSRTPLNALNLVIKLVYFESVSFFLPENYLQKSSLAFTQILGVWMKYTAKIFRCVECTYVHTHRNPKNTKHWRLSWFGYETFITFFKFRFFDTRRERHTIFLCWLFVHRQLSNNARTPRSPQTGLASPRSKKSTRFVQLQISTHCFYSKSLRIPVHRFRVWRHSYPQLHFLSGIFIVTSVIVTSSPRARVNTCVNVCNNPCTKPKGSKLN